MNAPRQRESVTGVRHPASGINIDTVKLKQMREERTWSREMLGKRAGISPATVTKLETGERRPKPATLAAICEALCCEPAELLVPLQEEK
jgi:DNA-binding Xre family transcriptional regulator